MMDRLRYDDSTQRRQVLEASLEQSQRLIERWHGRDDGRLRYAVTPRFAVSCTADMLRESAALAHSTGTYWQTHLAEDREEIQAVGRLFTDALDYTDVYERAGALGPQAIVAHAVHLSEREIGRLVETATRVAHCPSSNLFLSSGVMPLARYIEAGICVGLGSDVAGGPDLSIFGEMRAAAYTAKRLRTMLGDTPHRSHHSTGCASGTLDGARALGIDDLTGSLEVGKEADFIAVDARHTAPVAGQTTSDVEEIVSRLIFRGRAGMVRGAWVRGRRLPAATATDAHVTRRHPDPRRHPRRRQRARPVFGAHRRSARDRLPLVNAGETVEAARSHRRHGQGRRPRLHRSAFALGADDPRRPAPRAQGAPGSHHRDHRRRRAVVCAAPVAGRPRRADRDELGPRRRARYRG